MDSAFSGGKLKNSEALEKLDEKLTHLREDRARQLVDLVHEYECLFPDVPGQTHLIEHDIDLEETKPIQQRFFRVNLEKTKALDAEIAYLIQNGMVEPTKSGWSSPCILVPKANNILRFCTDYRKLNSDKTG